MNSPFCFSGSEWVTPIVGFSTCDRTCMQAVDLRGDLRKKGKNECSCVGYCSGQLGSLGGGAGHASASLGRASGHLIGSRPVGSGGQRKPWAGGLQSQGGRSVHQHVIEC